MLTKTLLATSLLALVAGAALGQTVTPAPLSASTDAPSAAAARPATPPSLGTATYDLLWWDCTPEYGGQAPDALREAMADYIDAFGGGTLFDTTFVASEIAGTFATHMASNDYDVIVFDCTPGGVPFDAADQSALTTFYSTHSNLLMDGTLYIRSIVFNATTVFPGVNNSSGDFTVNQVWQLADRGGGVMIGTDHDCCHAGPNFLLDAIIPDAEFSGFTIPSLDGQCNGQDLLMAIANVDVFALFSHWDSVPSEGIAPTGVFQDVFGADVEMFSQVDVADDPGGGPRFSYVSTSWEPSGTGPEFDCNDNGVLDSVDIANGTSEDVNCNMVPDECEGIGANYCDPIVPNTTGQPGGLFCIGSEVAADQNLTMTAYNVPPGNVCLFIASVNQGFNPTPGTSCGNLCLMGPDVARFKFDAQVVAGDGTCSLTIDPWVVLTNPPQPILARQTWNFQAWHRDSGAGPDCNNNFTEAVSITFQ